MSFAPIPPSFHRHDGVVFFLSESNGDHRFSLRGIPLDVRRRVTEWLQSNAAGAFEFDEVISGVWQPGRLIIRDAALAARFKSEMMEGR